MERTEAANRDLAPAGEPLPPPADLSVLSEQALRELTRRLETLVSSGGACLDDYGALALCHQEWARRGRSS